MQTQLSFFENGCAGSELCFADLVKSVSDSQAEILTGIVRLFSRGGIDLDCTYNKGNFYRHTTFQPRICTDLCPRVKGVIPADTRALPFKDKAFRCVVFDPPFFAHSRQVPTSIMAKKYGAPFRTPGALLEMYCASLLELHRVLKVDGILIFKCQDAVYGRTQYITHADVLRSGEEAGFRAIDLFIFIKKTAPMAWNHRDRQIHARKLHSYFIVFRKKRTRRVKA